MTSLLPQKLHISIYNVTTKYLVFIAKRVVTKNRSVSQNNSDAGVDWNNLRLFVSFSEFVYSHTYTASIRILYTRENTSSREPKIFKYNYDSYVHYIAWANRLWEKRVTADVAVETVIFVENL